MAETLQPDENSCNEMFMEYLARKNVVLPRSCVLRAVDDLLRAPEERLPNNETRIRRRVVSLCADRSHVRLTLNQYTNSTKNDISLLPIMREMRHCLLTGDWDGHKELLSTLLGSPNIDEHYVGYVIRSCFVLLFNHPNGTPEFVENFVASCLRIKDSSKRIKYLQDCFFLKRRMASNKDILEHGLTNYEENLVDEEEEMVFYSDCSSSD